MIKTTDRSRQVLYRIMDANANRAMEGLRVCEEVARFVLEHQSLTRRLRTIRHALALSMRKLSGAALLALHRDALQDVGRLFGSRRYTPGRWRELLLANGSRVKEALRVLEEFSRLLDGASAPRFQQIRFRFYAWERAALAELARLRYH